MGKIGIMQKLSYLHFHDDYYRQVFTLLNINKGLPFHFYSLLLKFTVMILFSRQKLLTFDRVILSAAKDLNHIFKRCHNFICLLLSMYLLSFPCL